MARTLATYLTNRINARPNTRGGYYKTAMHSARQYIDQGQKTGATPDGRRDGEELSKNSSAVMGMDKNGVTALAESVVSIAPWQFTEDFGFDVMLHTSATAGEDGLKAMHALLDAYMGAGGVSIQFNVFDGRHPARCAGAPGAIREPAGARVRLERALEQYAARRAGCVPAAGGSHRVGGASPGRYSTISPGR